MHSAATLGTSKVRMGGIGVVYRLFFAARLLSSVKAQSTRKSQPMMGAQNRTATHPWILPSLVRPSPFVSALRRRPGAPAQPDR